jgi:hypothetical protein
MATTSMGDTECTISCELCTFENNIYSSKCSLCNSNLFPGDTITASDTQQLIDDLQGKLISALDKTRNETVITKNYMDATEQIPESLIPVTMLYFKCSINGHQLTVFVDTGAQTSVMSKQCAEKCGVGHLIDTTQTGMAFGVGEQVILGRIWMLDLNFGEFVIPSSFIILDSDSINVIFGLDMIKSHGIILDCKNNMMRLNDVTIPFVDKSEKID